MKITQITDWSSETCSNLQRKNSPSTDNAWEEVNNENKETNRLKISSMCSLLQGLLIGSLSIGVVLAIVVTIWLTSPHSTSTYTNSTLSSTTSITTSLSSNSTTSITSSTTAISTTQSTTLTSSTISTTIPTRASTISITYTTTVPPNLLVNPGGENGTLSPWNSSSSGVPTIDDGSVNNGINPHSGSKDFYGGLINTGSTNTLTQSVCLLNGTQGYTETQLDSGSLTVNISFYEISLSQWLGTDQGQISLQFRTLNNTLISTITTTTFTCTSWCGRSYSFPLPIGTRCIDYIMVFGWVTGSVIDSYFDDNSLTVY